jgi:monofunctional biosynthetic peptidoglycan transglycosylase
MQPDLRKLPWQVVNDTVMGGLSRSEFMCDKPELRFSGELSLENSGGFASIISRLDAPLEDFAGLRLTVSGDGRCYQMRLRETGSSRDVAWRAFFSTSDEKTEVLLAPDDFEPVMRGEPAFGAKPLEHTAIHFIGFMLTSQRPGPFRLVVHALNIVLRENAHD